MRVCQNKLTHPHCFMYSLRDNNLFSLFTLLLFYLFTLLFFLEFTCEVELDVLEVLLSHRQHIARVGKEYIASVAVLSHILILALLELLEFLGVVALYPASLVQMNGFPTALGVIFVLQTILYNLKLQLTHGADNLTAVKLVDKQLCHTLVHELVDTLLKLLCLHRVVVLDILEHLWRERRQSAEVKLLALSQCVANLEDAVVGQTYDVARPCFVDGALALSHKLSGRRETQSLALTHMQIGLVALELAAAHLAEGDT